MEHKRPFLRIVIVVGAAYAALIAIVFSFAQAGTIHAQAQVAPGCDPVRIMPLGDSITQGKGEIADDPSLMIGYRKPLYEALQAAGHDVDFVGSQQAGEAISPPFDGDHEGHPGWTTAQLSDTVYSFLQATPAEVILLHIGTNDMGAGFDLEASTANVEQILDEIDRYDSEITVVLARIINKKTPIQEVSDFNDSIAALAQARIADGDKIHVVDQEKALAYPDDMEDSVHPKQSGYDKMAGVWLNALTGTIPTLCAELAIVKDRDQVVRSGGAASFTITVTNTGAAPLSGVEVTDAATPSCNRSIGDLEVGASLSFTCEAAGVTASFTNSATVAGSPPTGPTVQATDTAVVTVIDPSITIAKEGDRMVIDGGTATFTIAVTNTGDVGLTAVEVLDAATPTCDRTIGDLAAGQSASYSCEAANVTATLTNSATATGFPPAGPPVSATATAVVTAIHPSIAVDLRGDQTVTAGGTASFQIVVTNTGDTELTNVQVTAPETPACDRVMETLAPGELVSYTCQATNVTASFTSSVTAAALSPLGTPVAATDSARVEVLEEHTLFLPLIRK